MLRLLIFSIVAIALVSCASSPVTINQPKAIGESLPITSDSKICILVPRDANWENEQYPGSARQIAEKIQQALEKNGKSATTVNQSLANSLDICKEKGATFALNTSVLSYENNATGWSGRPDRIELKLSLYEIGNPETSRSIIYEAKSNVVVSGLFEWGNAEPWQLLGSDFKIAILGLMEKKG